MNLAMSDCEICAVERYSGAEPFADVLDIDRVGRFAVRHRVIAPSSGANCHSRRDGRVIPSFLRLAEQGRAKPNLGRVWPVDIGEPAGRHSLRIEHITPLLHLLPTASLAELHLARPGEREW